MDELRFWRERDDRALPVAVTPYYASLIDPNDPDDPIRLQCVPRRAELEEHPGQSRDSLAEEAHQVAPFLIRRYPDRALLLATDECATYCRHCTRRRRIGRGGPRALSELRPALTWLADHPEIEEVLISGGDPLVASTGWLAGLLEALRRIEHLGPIRVATRALVTLPMRVDQELCDTLRRFHPLYVVTHFNHPREMTPLARRACELLVDAGIPILNQAVLLRGVNDDAETQAELGRVLLRARVKPYYLMQGDAVTGTAHLRAPTTRGLAIVEELRRTLSGLAIPTYVLDLPGGKGKVTLAPGAIVGRDGDDLLLQSPQGEIVRYPDPLDSQEG